MNISAVVLTKNEEKNLGRALNSLSFCSEIIVVDDKSTDKTVEIAVGGGAKVAARELKGDFAAQRNFGLSKSRGDWVLFLDADEEVTKELRQEILKIINQESVKDAYYIKRRDIWWGRELRFGEVTSASNAGFIRLVKKGSGKWHHPVHETLITSSQVGRLKNFINHYPHQTTKEFLQAVNFYSTLRAKELLKENKKTNVFEIIAFPTGKFLHNYFLKLGFLDGVAGFIYSFMMSFHSFLVRAKLYQYRNLD